jgi:hypothetical protein
VLFLPLFCDFLLLDHNSVGTFFITFMAFFGLQKLVLKVGDFDIALIIKLVNPAMEHYFEAIELRNCTFLLIS